MECSVTLFQQLDNFDYLVLTLLSKISGGLSVSWLSKSQSPIESFGLLHQNPKSGRPSQIPSLHSIMSISILSQSKLHWVFVSILAGRVSQSIAGLQWNSVPSSKLGLYVRLRDRQWQPMSGMSGLSRVLGK